jgi:hypothetical protein
LSGSDYLIEPAEPLELSESEHIGVSAEIHDTLSVYLFSLPGTQHKARPLSSLLLSLSLSPPYHTLNNSLLQVWLPYFVGIFQLPHKAPWYLT